MFICRPLKSVDPIAKNDNQSPMKGGASFNDDFILQIYQGIFRWKEWKSVKIWQNYGPEFVASLFWPTVYIVSAHPVTVFRRPVPRYQAAGA